MSDGDSMWLQQSITIPDPLPDESETGETGTVESMPPPPPPPSSSQSSEPKPSQGAELSLTRVVMDPSSFLRSSAARPSLRQSTRASVSAAAFITAQEFDEMRARLSQAKRELLKLSDIQKDLDFARFELARAKEEATLLRESNAGLKREVEAQVTRAEKEQRAREQLDSQRVQESATLHREMDYMKQKMEDLRDDHTRRLNEITEQQEKEFQPRITSLREELAAAAEDALQLAGELSDMRQQKAAVEARLTSALSDAEKAFATVADLQKRCEAAEAEKQMLEEKHRNYVQQVAQETAAARQEFNTRAETRVAQLTEVKDSALRDLQEECQTYKDQSKSLGEELAALRHRASEAQSELLHLTATHAKELRRVAEEHRLEMAEKQQQIETAMREATGSKSTLEEEAVSLRRQVAQLSCELSTVAGVLVQREKQLTQVEGDWRSVKEQLTRLELQNAELAADADQQAEAAAEATERVERVVKQKDELEEAFTRDVCEAKDRMRMLEESLMEAKSELATLQQQYVTSSDTGMTALRDARQQLDAVTEERNTLRALAAERQRFEEAAELYSRKFEAERTRSKNLQVELQAAVGRCASLEDRLDSQVRRLLTSAASRSPLAVAGSAMPSQPSPQGLRSASCVNSHSPLRSSVKRARTEDARVFAISGFDGNDILLSLKQLPNVAIAECKSNMPVPSNLTHLITNGQLTIKLLTALVRGCWVLPESYIVDSLREKKWLSEADYGFQHMDPPLMKQPVAMTEAFMSCKHYSTAALLLKEGGAILVKEAGEANIVLCTNTEVKQHSSPMTWERMVEMVYPVKIQ